MKYALVSFHESPAKPKGIRYNEYEVIRTLLHDFRPEEVDCVVSYQPLSSEAVEDRSLIEVHTYTRWLQQGIVISYGSLQSIRLAATLAVAIGRELPPVPVRVKKASRWDRCHSRLRRGLTREPHVSLDLFGLWDRDTEKWVGTPDALVSLRRGIRQGLKWDNIWEESRATRT